jgi:hypothetical protein
MSGALDRPQGLYALAPAAQSMGQQDMLARLLRGNPDPSLPRYPVMQSAEDRGFRPIPFQGEGFQRMAAVLRGDVEPTPDEQMGMNVVRGFTEGPATIRAFHGSPHRFDRFDMSRIGTGEGAQAYGHGLYFAGNEGVARGYREALAPGAQVTLNGSPLAAANDPLKRVAMWIKNTGAHPDEIARISEQRAAKAAVDAQQLGLDGRAFADEHIAIAEAARNLSKSGKWEVGTAPNGTMYEVNLNTTPDRLLDWDAPLSKQSPIRSLIGDLGQQYANAGSAEARNVARDAFMAAKNENLSGAGVYNQLTRLANTGGAIGEHLGPLSPRMMSGPSVASQTLRKEAGIDGIQYLDAGSRAAGDGTRNYVMFDDKLIDILRRYGIAGTLGGGAAATAGTSE